MLSYYDRADMKIRHLSANACLTPLCSLNGFHVTSVEGVGSVRNGLHPIQQRMASLHGSQCGFCTPGIVMAIYTILRSNPNATPHDIEESLDGNLCRCTGYRPILDAAKSLSNMKGAGTGSCCMGKSGESFCPCAAAAATKGDCTTSSEDLDLVKSCTEQTVHSHAGVDEAMAQLSRVEPIFPPALVRFLPENMLICSDGHQWFQPADFVSMLRYKLRHPETKLVVGNSEIGIETKFKGFDYLHMMNPVHVSELKRITVESNGLRVGAAVTLNDFRDFSLSLISKASEGELFQYRGLSAMANMLRWFASNHIRNTACIGGNIVTASPISDMNPMLCACNAVLRIVSVSVDEECAAVNTRDLPITSFFKGYRKVDLYPSEVLQDVFIPFTERLEFVVPLKQARRREDDISIVTAGIRFKLTASHNIESCSLSYGGMAPTTILASGTMAFLTGKAFSEPVINDGCKVISEELALPLEVPGGQAAYRTCLAASFLYKAYVRICIDSRSLSSQISPLDASAGIAFVTEPKLLTRGEQSYHRRKGGLTNADHSADGDEQTARAPVGEDVAHKSSQLQCTGEAKYTDDIPTPAGCGYGALVMSSKAHAIIKSIDASKARELPGFIEIFDHRDIKGVNHCGPIHHDEEVFVSREVQHVGQVGCAFIYIQYLYAHQGRVDSNLTIEQKKIVDHCDCGGEEP